MGKIDPIARVVTIVGGKLAAVGGCDDVFGRAESAPWESAHIAMPRPHLDCWIQTNSETNLNLHAMILDAMN